MDELLRRAHDAFRAFLRAGGMAAPGLRDVGWCFDEAGRALVFQAWFEDGSEIGFRVAAALLYAFADFPIFEGLHVELRALYARLCQEHLRAFDLRGALEPYRGFGSRYQPSMVYSYQGLITAAAQQRTLEFNRPDAFNVSLRTEAIAAMRDAMERQLRDVLLRGVDWAVGCDPAANERAEKLLLDWLSPAQRAQYERQGAFEVKGGESGKRYRIRFGTAQNVDELNWRGRKVSGWCFAPDGYLAPGDVMLAQKIALETDERAALAVAVRY